MGWFNRLFPRRIWETGILDASVLGGDQPFGFLAFWLFRE